MKKLAGFLLTAALLLSAVGCGQAATLEPTPALPSPGLTASQSSLPVAAPAFTPVPLPTPIKLPAKGYCNGEGVNLRAQPGTAGEVVNILGQNAVLDVLSLENGWYMVKYDGVTAYIKSDLVTLGTPPRPDNMRWAKVSAAETQLYKSPGADPSEVKLKEGDVVRVLRSIDGYLHIVYKNTLQRYLKAEDVTYISAEEAAAALAGAEETMFPTPEDTPKATAKASAKPTPKPTAKPTTKP